MNKLLNFKQTSRCRQLTSFVVFSFAKNKPKYERFIKPENKDFTQNPIFQEKVQNILQEGLKNTPDSFTELSKSVEHDPQTSKKVKLYRRFSPDRKVLNKKFKKSLNQTIEEAVLDSEKYVTSKDMRPTWKQITEAEENERKWEELVEYKKTLFKKQETKRLIEREKRKPENYLPNHPDHPPVNLSVDIYSETLNMMKNKRIANMLSSVNSNNENKKLALLIQGGLMDDSKTIGEVIERSLELKKLSALSHEMIDNRPQEFVIGDTENSTEQTHPASEFEVVQKEDPDEDNSRIFEDYLKIYNASEASDEAMQEKLKEFVREFLLATPKEKASLLDSLRLAKEIRNFEESIFDRYRNNDITLRVKGRLQFTDLTEPEHVNYIKYNIENYEDLLQMWDSSQEVMTPKVASAMLQKTALLYIIDQTPAENKKTRFLAVLKNPRYRAILRYFTNNVKDMADRDFILGVWSLGKMHREEGGLLYPELFNIMSSRVLSEVNERITHLELREIGCLTQGLLMLSSSEIFNIMDKEYRNIPSSIASRMVESVDSIVDFQPSEILAVTRILSFLGFVSEENYLKVTPVVAQKLLDSKTKLEAIDDIVDFNLALLPYVTKKIKRAGKPDNAKDSLPALKENDLPVVRKLVKSYVPKLQEYAPHLHIKELGDIMLVLNALEINNEGVVAAFKGRYVKAVKHLQKAHAYDHAELCCSFALADLQMNYPISGNPPTLLLGMLTLNLFPRKVFVSGRSPQYIPYFHFAKTLSENQKTYDPRFQIVTLFGLTSVKYVNWEMFKSIFEGLEPFIDETDRFDLLGYLLQINSNLKNNATLYYKTLFRIVQLMNEAQTIKRATPVFWTQLVVSVANLGDPEGAITQNYMEKVIKKLKFHVKNLDKELLVPLYWAFAKLQMTSDTEILTEILEKLQSQPLNSQLFYLYYQACCLYDLTLKDDSKAKQMVREFLANKSNFKKYSSISEEFYKKKLELEEVIPGSRMTSESAATEIYGFLKDLGYTPSRAEIGGVWAPTYLKAENKVINVYSSEDLLIDQKTPIGIVDAEEQIIKLGRGCEIVRIYLKEYKIQGSECETVEDIKKARKKFLADALTQPAME